MEEVEALLSMLEGDADLEQVRDDIAKLIVRLVQSRGRAISYWEKVHFEMAIALLPTVWLRLCLSHLRMALEPPPDEPRFFENLERIEHFDALTADELIGRVGRMGYRMS